MLDVSITTYWNVETLYYVFNAVAALMGGAGFSGLLKMVFIFAIGIGMFAYLAGKQLEWVTWFFQALVLVSLLNLPIARVTLTDQTNLQPPRVVANVPLAMAVLGQTVNLSFGFITRQYESAFGVPDELGLAQGDVGFGHRILKQVNHAEIQDPGLRADLLQFLKECTLYDIRDGQVTPQQLIGGTDVWTLLFTNTSPARFVSYQTLSATPTTDTCQNVALVLKTEVDAAVLSAQTFYGKQAFPLAQSNELARTLFLGAVGTSYDWILQSSQSASDAVRQSMFNNLWRQAGTSLPAMLNDPAQVAEVAALAGEAQAAAQANGSNSVLSLLGQETLPHMRNWLEAILYAMFPVVVILVVVTPADGARKVLGGYLMSLAWIGLWPVLFAVINHLSLMYLRHKAAALALSAGVPFQLSDSFGSMLVDEQAQIGYMVVLVPFVAAGILRFSQGGLMAVADRAIAGFTASGAAAGAGWAAGNVSLGQAGLDTHSVNTTSMHKMDYNLSLEGGGAAMGTSGGGVARLAVNGAAAMEQMHSRFVASMSTDSRMDAQRSQEAHATSIAVSGHAVANRHSDASSLTHVTGHDNTRASLQSRGVDTAVSEQGSHGGSVDRGQGLHTSNRDVSTFQMGAGSHDNANVGANAGIGQGVSGGPGGGAGAGMDPKEERRISDAMKQGGASQEAIEKAVGNYRSSKGGPNGDLSIGRHAGLSLGLSTSKSYDASHTQNKAHEETHTTDEIARLSTSFQERGSRSVRAGTGEQSAQSNRDGRDAARSNVDEYSSVSDAVERVEQGVGDRTSRSESSAFNVRRDLLNDPGFMQRVAHRNGMSAMRFYSQETPTILQQAQDYAAEMDMVVAASRLDHATFAGDSLPSTRSELHAAALRDQGAIRNDIDRKHRRKQGQTGFAGASALPVRTGLPAMGSDARGAVEGNLNALDSGSVPARAAAFDENVAAWASHDKKVGEGRANPAAVVNAMEERDIKDTVNKLADKLTGGDGTADGEKLNANQKREDSPGF